MGQWTVKGAFLARRNYWQSFSKTTEAASSEAAREWAVSQIGGCHRVARRLIRIDSIAGA